MVNRIVMIGHFDERIDEASRIIANNLRERLIELKLQVVKIDWDALNSKIEEMQKFNPDVIHALGGPSSRLIFLALGKIKKALPSVPLIFSAVQPTMKHLPRFHIVNKIDLAIIQSFRSQKLFENCGISTAFLPNGVDLNRFSPIDQLRKSEIRRNLGIDLDKQMILHIGSIRRKRGVEILSHLPSTSREVCIIVPDYSKSERGLVKELRDRGCRLIEGHQPEIQDYYRAADAYVFPTPAINFGESVDCPLSVLEAMASNIRVITTRFGSLPRMFEESGSIHFFENEDELIRMLDDSRTEGTPTSRDSVAELDWKDIAQRLLDIYDKHHAKRAAIGVK